MSRHRALPILAIAALLALGGCSASEPTFDPDPVAEAPQKQPAEGSAPEAPREIIDVCAALSGVDLEVLMGEEMAEPSGESGACTAEATAAMSAARIHVLANVDGARSYENQKSLLTVTAELDAPGDEAFLGDTALAKGLDVLSGGHHLSVRIHRQSSPITGDELIAVAQAVLRNLGW